MGDLRTPKYTKTQSQRFLRLWFIRATFQDICFRSSQTWRSVAGSKRYPMLHKKLLLDFISNLLDAVVNIGKWRARVIHHLHPGGHPYMAASITTAASSLGPKETKDGADQKPWCEGRPTKPHWKHGSTTTTTLASAPRQKSQHKIHHNSLCLSVIIYVSFC